MPGQLSRRSFTKTAVSAAVATGALTGTSRAGRIIGANDRVRVGCIGVGNRGCQVLDAFHAQADAEMVALCDVYETYLKGAYDQAKPRWSDLTSQIPRSQPARAKEPDHYKD